MVISPLDSRSPEARKFLDDMSVWIYLLPRYCRCSSKTAEKLLREIGPLVAKDRRAQAEQINSRWSVPLAQGRSRIGVEKEIEQLFVEHLPMPVTLKLVRHPGGELRFKIDNDSAQFSTAFAVSPSDQRAVNELGPDYLDAHAYGRFGAHWAESKAAELVGFEVWTNKSTTHSVVFCPDGSILDDKFTEPAASHARRPGRHQIGLRVCPPSDRHAAHYVDRNLRRRTAGAAIGHLFGGICLSQRAPLRQADLGNSGWHSDRRAGLLHELPQQRSQD